MIWLSVNLDFFIRDSLVLQCKSLYLKPRSFFGGITVSIGRFYQSAASETEADGGSVRLLTGKFPETGVKRIFSELKDRKLSVKNQASSGYQVYAEKIRGALGGLALWVVSALK